MWSKRSRNVAGLAPVCLLMVSLAGCDSVRESMGLTKEPPDEFAVVSKSPLIIPPDYHLTPPKPGAPPLNQVSPTQSAEAALYSDDPKTAAASISGNYSPGEKLLLAQTGAAAMTDSIRQQIAADNSDDDSADESFTDHLLFGTSDTGDAPLNADAEKARIDAGKGAPAQQQTQQKDSGGWLDGIF